MMLPCPAAAWLAHALEKGAFRACAPVGMLQGPLPGARQGLQGCTRPQGNLLLAKRHQTTWCL